MLVQVKVLDVNGSVGIIEVPSSIRNEGFKKAIQNKRLYLNGEYVGCYGHSIIVNQKEECPKQDYCITCDCDGCKFEVIHSVVFHFPKLARFIQSNRQFLVKVFDYDCNAWIPIEVCPTHSSAVERMNSIICDGTPEEEVRIEKIEE